jgi:hypothetical protein
MKDLKYYLLQVNDEDSTGMYALSLVERPAVGQALFYAFDEDKPLVGYKFQEAEQIITGVAMLADIPIYRNSEPLGEHYIILTKEVIKKMVEKLFKVGKFNNINLQHNDDAKVNEVFLTESYFIDREKGINPLDFKKATDGSWVVSYKVANKELFNQIVSTNKFNGFSLEGIFEYVSIDKFSETKNVFEEYINELLN